MRLYLAHTNQEKEEERKRRNEGEKKKGKGEGEKRRRGKGGPAGQPARPGAARTPGSSSPGTAGATHLCAWIGARY